MAQHCSCDGFTSRVSRFVAPKNSKHAKCRHSYTESVIKSKKVQHGCEVAVNPRMGRIQLVQWWRKNGPTASLEGGTGRLAHPHR
jgi:hypothetical protein